MEDMGRIWSCGFELNSLTPGVEVEEIIGDPSIDSGTFRSGAYSLKAIADSGTGDAIRKIFSSSDNEIPYYARSYIRFTANPGDFNAILAFGDSGGNLLGRVLLEPNGAVGLFDLGPDRIGSPSSPLSTNTWYRIELYYFSNPDTELAELELRLNGVSIASTNSSVNNGGVSRLLAGAVTNNALTIYHDDIAINDNTGSYQNFYPGEGSIIHLRPNAAGDSNGFAIAIGGTAGSSNNFTRANEVTPDDATSYNGSAILNSEDLFNITNSGLASTSVINVVSVGIRMADLVSTDATAAFKVELEKTSGGTKSQSGTLIPNSTAWVTNAATAPRNYPLTTYLDPDGASWSQSTLDSMQIGYIQTATNLQTIAVSTVWALIDYAPAPTFSISDNINLLENISSSKANNIDLGIGIHNGPKIV